VGKENVSPVGILTGDVVCPLTSIANDDWIINSGASEHTTPHHSLLHLTQLIKQPCFITMPNGKQVRVSHIRIVMLGGWYTIIRASMCS